MWERDVNTSWHVAMVAPAKKILSKQFQEFVKNVISTIQCFFTPSHSCIIIYRYLQFCSGHSIVKLKRIIKHVHLNGTQKPTPRKNNFIGCSDI